MAARGIDHVVWAVRDLDRTAEHIERLGFTLTPRARHPWGTVNRLVQLDGAFLELLSIGEGAEPARAEPGIFSFGAFNRDFLETGEGGSMLALESSDPEADRTAFAAAGLPTYAPFSFERTARSADGTERKVAFDLTFTTDAAASNLGFFTSRHRYPENFWSSAYQAHANTARAVATVVFVMADPADHHVFFSAFTGRREMRASSLGIELATPRGQIQLLTPVAYRSLYGDRAADSLADLPSLAAVRISVADRTALRRILEDGGVAFDDTAAGLVVAGGSNFGLTLAFD